jgi:N,N'-diacetyllegionaminate synthase
LNNKIKIANTSVGNNSKVFIIAEAGSNHNGDIKIAKKMIEAAKLSDIDAIKFQTFRAKDFVVSDSKAFKILKKVELTSLDFEELSDFAKSQGIIFFSTPLSENATDILSKLSVPVFKIASGDLTHIPLIKYVAKKRKPIILSTGMASMDEVKNAVKAVCSQNNEKIIILHSVSGYPTPYNEANLNMIRTLKKEFQYPIGFSDNGEGTFVPLLAVANGAKIIEKHFTLSKKIKCLDRSISLDPKEFKHLVEETRKIEEILGDGIKKCQPSEMEDRIQSRRSLLAEIEIKKGTKITREMIGIKRPALGISPAFLEKVVGKVSQKNIQPRHFIKWSDVKNKNI